MIDLMEQDQTYVANTYARFPLTLTRGEGAVAYDDTGKAYIDMGSGIGVTAFGYRDREWTDAVKAQLDLLQHASNLYYTQPCAQLAQMLCQRTGMKKVFFSNSGAEANECAIKTARKWAAEKKGPDCQTIITLVNSFHGRTITALAATGQDAYHRHFQPLTPGFLHTPAGDFAALEQLVKEHQVAGILLECVQGEGGVMALDPDFLRQAAALCRQEDILLMIDEVQTGNGRTGKLYSYMHYGVQPDIVSTAKGLGGGLPLGATLLGEKVEHTLGRGDHGSTFGGNPVCCAGAVNILSRLDDAFLEQVAAKGRRIREVLEQAEGVEAVTGLGLMVGVKTTKPVAQVIARCREQGVLCLSAKDKLRLLPPLSIPESLLEQALEVIREACRMT